MAINDILSSLLEKTGLKKTDRQVCEEAIKAHEARIRDFNDDLARLIEEVKRAEARLRAMKAQNDAAHGAAKKLYEAQLCSLMKDFKHVKELQELKLRNLEKEKLLLQNRRLELENLTHPTDPDAVDDAINSKDDLLADLADEDRQLSELEGKTYQKESTEEASFDVTDKKADADKLERELAELLGEAEADSEKTDTEDVSENEPVEA